MKIGMLSAAHVHTEGYAACIAQLPGLELTGIYDDDPSRGKAFAERFGTAFFEDIEALLAKGLDGVIICSENVKHRALAEQAAGKVKAILCEKPIATTREDAEAMIARCQETGTKLQIAFPVRFAPPAMRLKEVLDQGTLGAPVSVTCTNHGRMPGGWFADKALAGGGAVMDHTVHVIDLLRWFWNTEVKEVYAEVADSLLHPGLGIDDAGMLSFVLENGVYGTLDTSWSRPQSYPVWGDVKIDLLAEHGVLRVDVFRQQLMLSSDKSGKTDYVPWGSNPDLGLIRDFTDMIRQDRDPSITGTDGLRALEVALAAYRSAAQGQPIPPRQP